MQSFINNSVKKHVNYLIKVMKMIIEAMFKINILKGSLK